MGFHLVQQVYDNVKGTNPTTQSVLICLAHHYDDSDQRKCYPPISRIRRETHFSITAISDALQRLKKMKLIWWEKGGLHKGPNGGNLANVYHFNIPNQPTEYEDVPAAEGKKAAPKAAPSADNAAPPSNDVTAPPPPDPCTPKDEACDRALDQLSKSLAVEARKKNAQKSKPAQPAEQQSLIDYAASVCGGLTHDHRQQLMSLMLKKDPNDCRASIDECRQLVKTQLYALSYKARGAFLYRLLVMLPDKPPTP